MLGVAEPRPSRATCHPWLSLKEALTGRTTVKFDNSNQFNIHVPGLARPFGWQLPKSTGLTILKFESDSVAVATANLSYSLPLCDSTTDGKTSELCIALDRQQLEATCWLPN